VGASRHEMLDHARQIGIEERLADTVQQDALERGELIDDLSEAGPGQILGRLASSEGEDAGLTLRVAAARRLHVQRARERRTERQGRDGHHAAPFVVRSAITKKA